MQKFQTLLVFAEGDTHCALPAGDVREVVFLPELSHPPGMPAILEGMMSLEGQSLPVLRAARLLGLAAQASGIYTPAIVLKEGRAVLAVERLEGMLKVTPDEILPAPKGHSFNDCLSGLARTKDRDVHLLSSSQLLLKEELLRIEEFQIRANERLAQSGSQDR
jgi:chemotaxis signal transduction protein